MSHDTYVPFLEVGPNLSIGFDKPQRTLHDLTKVAMRLSGGVALSGEDVLTRDTRNKLVVLTHGSYIDGPYAGSKIIDLLDGLDYPAQFSAVMMDNIVRKSPYFKDKVVAAAGKKSSVLGTFTEVILNRIDNRTKFFEHLPTAMSDFHERAGLMVVNNQEGSAKLAYKLGKKLLRMKQENESGKMTHVVVLFPQGERRDEFLREDINPGVLFMARSLGADIIPGGIGGGDVIWKRGQAPKQRAEVQISFGEKIAFDDLPKDGGAALDVIYSRMKEQLRASQELFKIFN